MRLINAALLELERFDDDTKIPPYAILSHTWGDAEVSLQQFQDTYMGEEHTRSRVKQKAGWAKIVRASKQALDDGYAYIWVDTCCIDKTSSAELSEAINSMYRWYKRAEVCYAYLEDVAAETSFLARIQSTDTLLPSDDHIKSSLVNARWFTRGWTLQELIAPKQVRFYGTDWAFIGTKETLQDLLVAITSIDFDALDGEPPESFSVSKRMSWAANRKTTRIEDLAYSLMGLFDVNMPLLYGEGEKAFMRLQEQILSDDDDQTLFAWTPVAPRPSPYALGTSIFAQHPSDFVDGFKFHSYVPYGEPPIVTNKGLKIELPVLSLRNIPHGVMDPRFKDYFLLVLYCGYHDDPLVHPAIVARRTGSYGQTYVRHESRALFPVKHEDVRLTDSRQIYLRRRPKRFALYNRQLDYRALPTSQPVDETLKIRSYEPRDGWPRIPYSGLEID
ncbi:heterokaryon incompatibility protein-domain-containing protein [Paraphoma chrysanthemicola]|uniref:Heterokaryon incompatibility protein-domain-containing protein n=1 Tax=Paraphoma chrysanthemicola TaxID=798071 RepID=A0A8K0RC98_9PLEO|nr:heterokaryon incompatibility protein-domain-containing protein [Paraphoma chrysanthemicola]